MSKVLITGANGQLGSELRHLLDERGVAYDAFDSHGLDITDQEIVNEKITALKPAVIYHCAAYTAVDNAEDQFKAANYQVNVDGTAMSPKRRPRLARSWSTSVPITSLTGPRQASTKWTTQPEE